jgi:uncharacterized protein YqgC (DUF456 family)
MDFSPRLIMAAGAIYTLAGIICLAGILLSCLSLSGTWLVLAATGLVAWSRWPEFPHIGILVVFLVLCIATEVLEAVAGAWGVQKRGGSKAAGWAALGGGFIGMILGGFIPVPILGNLIGMFAGSFGCAFWIEHAKMKQADHAAHVAFGAVLARIGVIFLKVGITLAMITTLIIGITLS